MSAVTGSWRRARWPSVLGTLLAASAGVSTGGAGCRSEHGAAIGMCTKDAECGDMALCMARTCVRRGTARTVAVEILPRADSTAARTGVAVLALGSNEIHLAADPQVLVTGTVTNAPNAHVVMLIPSPIPGQSDLQFETDLTTQSGTQTQFQIGMGSQIARLMATIWLIPSAEPQILPPAPFAAMLGPALSFTFPPTSDLIAINGVLHDSLDQPPARFLARALVGNQVVSNAATTDTSGVFHLLVAPRSLSGSDAMVTLDFTPVTVEKSPPLAPRFQSVPMPLAAMAGNAKLPTFHVPAYLEPVPLQFVVKAGIYDTPIQDVTMRFRTTIPATDDGGQAIYEREARTDPFGAASVTLIPGTAAGPRRYQIAILPPPDSPYGARCVSNSPVTGGGNDTQQQYAATFPLEPKVVLRGFIFSSTKAPAAAVSVMATRIPMDPAVPDDDCGLVSASSPVSTATLANGYYEMLVDPGRYRLDIDPPPGSDVPRLTKDGEDAVIASADSMPLPVELPAGEVIDGDVVIGQTGSTKLGMASLKIFKVLCEGATCTGPKRIPPQLLAQTRTDIAGHFRAVLPPP